MKREIKFRAWNNKSHGWVYITIGQSLDPYVVSVINDIALSGNQWYEFPGIKDKNGKEIYQGDVVAFKFMQELNSHIELKGIFFFDDTELRYQIEILGNNEYAVLNYFYNGQMYDFEIIGNIYENPELLK